MLLLWKTFLSSQSFKERLGLINCELKIWKFYYFSFNSRVFLRCSELSDYIGIIILHHDARCTSVSWLLTLLFIKLITTIYLGWNWEKSKYIILQLTVGFCKTVPDFKYNLILFLHFNITCFTPVLFQCQDKFLPFQFFRFVDNIFKLWTSQILVLKVS